MVTGQTQDYGHFFFFLRYFLDSVQLLSHVWLLATAWTAAHQASLFITKSWNLLKLMSIESVMPSNHFILCRPIFLNIFTEFVTVLLLFHILFFFLPWGMWDLSALTKDWTLGVVSLWPPRGHEIRELLPLTCLRELGTSCLPKRFIWASWRPCH